MEKTQKIKFIIFFAFASIFFIFSPAAAQAASLYFSPSSGSHAVGDTFSVGVYVSSADQAMNAASGVISFPSDKLEVTSLSKTGSIFGLWVQDPSFSNSAGTVNFEGIALNPGFTGASGKLITVNFRARAAGAATLNFSSGSVLANDGQGTNILTSLGTASFSLGIVEPAVPEAETPPTIVGMPAAPQISSPTHPDPNKWYAVNDAKFTWQVPAGVTAVRLFYDKYPNSKPQVSYSPPISEKQLEDIKDGIWYFHAQFRNAKGWGESSHFRFQIDTQPPEPMVIEFVDGKIVEVPRVKILFNTVDVLSGIDYYRIKIGDVPVSDISSNDVVSSNPYTLSPQKPGTHSLEILAFDKAGNFISVKENFTIKPALPPQITEFPQELKSGEEVSIKGETVYPNAPIIIFFQREGVEPDKYLITSDEQGKFSFISTKGLNVGTYNLWVEVTDEKGTQGVASKKVLITVKTQFFEIGSLATEFLAVVIPLVALIFALLFIIWHGWHKFSSLRKRVSKETKEAERTLHQAFTALKKETEEQVAKLDGKPDLSEREKKICNNLKKALKISEEFIGKEIEDIEKEIKK